MDGMARASVSQAVAYMSTLKNVPLSAGQRDSFVKLITEPGWPYGDVNDPAQRMAAISAQLDLLAAARLMEIISGIEGNTGTEDAVVNATVDHIVREVEARQASTALRHWPDLMALVTMHYAGKVRGPTVGVCKDGTICTRYWKGLLMHRDPREGPANVEVLGDRRLEEYFVDGEAHRPHEDGPAKIYTHYRDFDLSGEEYWEHGKLHRPAELGPAVAHRDLKGEPVMRLYFENGESHRDPSQGPAWWEIHDARTDRDALRPFVEERYCVRGQAHRDEKDGPACVETDVATGVITREEYRRDGRAYSESGPSIVDRRPDGTLYFESYCHDERFRDTREGPSTINYDAEGRVLGESWLDPDGRHRDAAKGPGYVRYDRSNGRRHEEFYVGDALRQAALGPAIVMRDRDGNVLWQEFWDGERMHVKHAEPAGAEAGTHG
jgi:hypothetical protein